MLFRRGAARALVALLVAGGLAGCTADQPRQEQPSFYRSLAASGASVDSQTAASMISGYRQNNGLPPVAIDPELTRLAEVQAQAMATQDKVDQRAAGAISIRLRRSGYNAAVAGENISAGYHTLAEAFSGWRDSPPHRANMLLKGATKMGIAAIYAPNSKYKVFWSLILAAPDERRG